MRSNRATTLLGLIGVVGLLAFVAWLSWRMPAHIAALVGTAVGFVVTKAYEAQREAQARVYERKREAYVRLLKPWRELLLEFTFGGRKEAEPLPPGFAKEAFDAAFDALLFGSDDVVRTYGKFRTMGLGGPPAADIVMRRMAELFRAMRKDLGHSMTALQNDEIMMLFVNLDEAQRTLLRSAI